MLKISGGEWRGRSIRAPEGQETRPTQERLRQAWMNALQFEIPEARILDLYSGSGALGIEALSRGAGFVLFVENHRKTAKLIQDNLKAFEVPLSRAIVQCASVDEILSRRHSGSEHFVEPFDLVFADPPYDLDQERWLLQGGAHDWTRILNPGGKLILEWSPLKTRRLFGFSELPQKAGILEKFKEKAYGDSVLTTYLRGETT